MSPPHANAVLAALCVRALYPGAGLACRGLACHALAPATSSPAISSEPTAVGSLWARDRRGLLLARGRMNGMAPKKKGDISFFVRFVRDSPIVTKDREACAESGELEAQRTVV